MPQRKQLSWSELRVGVFVLAGIIIVIAGIFYVTGMGALTPKYRLVTYLPEAEGLAVGAPVTLDGVAAGNVETIRLAVFKPGEPHNADRSVEVVMAVNRDFSDYILTDSTASLKTQGFLGDRVVTIQRGYTGNPLKNGEEVPGAAEKGINEVMAHGADLMDSLNSLSVKVTAIVNGIQSGRGTLGKLLTDESVYNKLNDTVGHVDHIASSVEAGQGTVGKLFVSDELYGKVDSATSRADNILGAVEQQQGTLGKIIYDPSIHDSAKQFLSNSNGLLTDVRAGRGTLGKLATDDSLFAAWRQTGENLSAATAKLNDNGSTAGKLFSDPQLYDNLTGLTGDMRLLLNEFQRDPKKFLRVRFSIF